MWFTELKPGHLCNITIISQMHLKQHRKSLCERDHRHLSKYPLCSKKPLGSKHIRAFGWWDFVILIYCAHVVINHIDFQLVHLPKKLSFQFSPLLPNFGLRAFFVKKTCFINIHYICLQYFPCWRGLSWMLSKRGFQRHNTNMSLFNFNYNRKIFPVVSGNPNVTEQRLQPRANQVKNKQTT